MGVISLLCHSKRVIQVLVWKKGKKGDYSKELYFDFVFFVDDSSFSERQYSG